MFTDDDLFFWKNLTGNHELEDDVENLEIHPGTLKDLLNRLEAAEQVCIDVGYPDHPRFLDEMPWRRAHYSVWQKAAGK